MFRRLSEPLPLSEASLLAFRPALNAPVLNVDFLPVGPARAAIVVFAEEWGGIGLALGIRSNEGGQVAVLGNQEPIDASTPIASALEPVLSTAERMGFLFDEDMVEGPSGDRGHAMSLWERLMGEVELSPALAAAPAEAAEDEPILDLSDPLDDDLSADDLDVADFELDDLAELSLDDVPLELTDSILDAPEREPASESAATVEAAQDAALPREVDLLLGARSLSKFRHVESTADLAGSGPKAGGSSKLARIPLVRVRRGREGGIKRVSYLARLLSSF